MYYHAVEKKPVFLKRALKGDEVPGGTDLRLKVML